MTLIKGSFRIKGTSPDGDSVRFYPDSASAFTDAGLRVRTNAAGGAQLRLDGIDALETHYRPPNAHTTWRQPAELGGAAGTALLTSLGFESVERDEHGTVTGSSPEQTRGYILTRFADVYGRAVAFAFAGSRRNPDGGQVRLEVADAAKSANGQLLAAGLVYPTFYSKLYVDVRQAMAETAVAARAKKLGVWAKDATLPGFRLSSRAQLSDEVVLLPKLFRRLAEYLSGTSDVSLTGFGAFLAAHHDRLFTVPDGHATELDTLVEVKRQTLRLTVAPEQIVFLEA